MFGSWSTTRRASKSTIWLTFSPQDALFSTNLVLVYLAIKGKNPNMTANNMPMLLPCHGYSMFCLAWNLLMHLPTIPLAKLPSAVTCGCEETTDQTKKVWNQRNAFYNKKYCSGKHNDTKQVRPRYVFDQKWTWSYRKFVPCYPCIILFFLVCAQPLVRLSKISGKWLVHFIMLLRWLVRVQDRVEKVCYCFIKVEGRQ